MKMTQDFQPGSYQIRSYTPGQIRINDQTLQTNVLLSPSDLIPDWAPGGLDALGETEAEQVLALAPEVVLLGTGATQRFPDRAWLRELLMRGVGVEVMDTAAASRTYNVLVGEERRVVAGLLVK